MDSMDFGIDMDLVTMILEGARDQIKVLQRAKNENTNLNVDDNNSRAIDGMENSSSSMGGEEAVASTQRLQTEDTLYHTQHQARPTVYRHHRASGSRVNNQVVRLVQRLADQVHVANSLKPLNARSCVVCGDGTRKLTMRSNGFKCDACLGKPSKQKYVVIPEEYSHLEMMRRGGRSGGDPLSAFGGGRNNFRRGSVDTEDSEADFNMTIGGGDNRVGCIVNDFVLEERLGKGSQATVYQAYHVTNPQMKFAVKAVKRTNNPAAMTAVNREFNIMKTLNHPSLIHIIALINDPNPTAEYIFIVMEMLKGQIFDPPQTEGEKVDPIPINRLKKYLVGIASGLEYLHKKGIFHRDIKPENILLDDSDNVRVADFGVSCTGDGGDLDGVASGEGTPMYFPPENFGAERVHGRAQDIWAFGVTIYVMACGYYPFPLIPNKMRSNIESMPIEYPDEMDPDLKDLLSSMLIRVPTKRISTQGILAHTFLANVHQAKGYPVEPKTGTIACVSNHAEADAIPTTGEGSVDGIFIITDQARQQAPAMQALSDFIEKNGPSFQLLTAQYSTTLFATK